MSDEKLDQEQEEETPDTSKPEPGSESEDTSEELDSLFGDDSQEEPKEETPDEKIVRLEKTVASLEKGMKKAFSRQGVEKFKEKEVDTKEQTRPSDEAEVLFHRITPEAENVKSELKKVADSLYGGSVLKAWDNEPWLQEKAKHLAEAKQEEEKNKSKVNQPSSTTGNQKKDLASVKAEDVEKLTPAEKIKWIKIQADKERSRVD